LLESERGSGCGGDSGDDNADDNDDDADGLCGGDVIIIFSPRTSAAGLESGGITKPVAVVVVDEVVEAVTSRISTSPLLLL
jgi:hypothetical protein